MTLPRYIFHNKPSQVNARRKMSKIFYSLQDAAIHNWEIQESVWDHVIELSDHDAEEMAVVLSEVNAIANAIANANARIEWNDSFNFAHTFAFGSIRWRVQRSAKKRRKSFSRNTTFRHCASCRIGRHIFYSWIALDSHIL